MKKIALLFTVTSLITANVNAQLFTKITNQIIVEDSCNSYYACWGDYDNDNDLDLFLPMWLPSPVNPLSKNFMYQNNCNGSFTRIKAIPGGLVTDVGRHFGAYWIDYNNDGNLDLFSWAGYKNIMYKNNGDGSFSKPGIALDTTSSGSAAWADYNNDGILDVFLGNAFYKGNGVDFTYISNSNLVFILVQQDGSAWADYDNDGYMDLYICTTWTATHENYLYHNNGDGTFTRIMNGPGSVHGINYGCAWGDYDNDGFLDLWISNSYDHDFLYHNNGDGTFTHITTGPIVTRPTDITHSSAQAGAAWCDYDNDGDLDLFIPTFYQNLLFDNNGDGTFTKNTTEIVTYDTPNESYGACWADYNNDGAIDLFVNTGWFDANDLLYKNILYENNGNGNHWLKFKCTGVTTNRDALGARVYAKATINGNPVWQMREITANTTRGGESGGASGHVVHIGFGDASVIDTLKIVWPASHTTQVFTNVAPDRYIEITEGDNTIYAGKECLPDLPPRNPGFIEGTVYNDLDSNCVLDTVADIPIVNRMIEARPGPYFVFSNDKGAYKFRLADGTYNIKEVNIPDDIWQLQNCQQDSIYSISLAGGTFVTGKDFAKQPGPLAKVCSAVIDIYSMPGVFEGPCSPPNLTTPCPKYYWRYCVTITNNGTINIGPQSTLQVVLDPYMTFVSEVIPNGCGFGTPVVTGSGTIITWTGNNLISPGDYCSFCFDVYLDPLAGLSSLSTANFVAQCGNLTYPSTDQELQLNLCSCDPNDKLVAPKGCGPLGNIGKNEPLTYTVRFQNTGTGPAHNIIIRDAIDSNLDITTLKILSSTYPPTNIEIIPDNALIISYEGIELPDSASNPEGSKGTIMFSLLPKNNIADGTQINNQAGIYFDFNDVVLTNSTLNTLWGNPYPVADFTAKHSCTNTGQVYDFTYTGGTIDNVIFLWNFGNDATPSTSNLQNPSGIVYNTIGTKQVTLTVSRNGCSSTITKNIEVISVLTGKKKNKVIICHNGNTIEVNLNALPAHLAHGDCVGACNNNNSKLAFQNDFSENDNIEILIIPNPNDGKFTLKYTGFTEGNLQSENDKFEICIYDVFGKIIFKSQITKPNSTIDLSSYSKGLYFYKASSEIKFISTGKLIIQ